MSSDQHRSRRNPSTSSHRRRKHDDPYTPSSASSSDHSDRGTTSYHSSSRRVLAHVLARKERESNQMHQLLQLSFAKLDEESQRATDAERRATECLVRARAAIDARAQADADAAAARTELSMYKMQLEQAQREISRAQEMLDGLEARRHDAEQDAARSRSVARKLQEERSIEAAREEGKQQGYHEGLRQGILLGRREAENELRSRRHEEEEDEDGRRSRSRRRGVGDPAFTLVTPISPQQSTSERSDDLLPRGVPNRRTPEIGPIAPVPSVPVRTTPFRRSPEQAYLSNTAPRRHNNHTPDDQLYDSDQTPSPPQSRSRSRPSLPLEPARSRPYTPHDDSTPSIIQPIPIPATASASSIDPIPLPPSPSASSIRHPPVRIPPDNWIPRAQDPTGDGRLSIFLPPPHELGGPVLVPDGPYAIAATPESGSPAVIPPPPILSRSSSPGPGNRRSPDYAYTTPPPPDLGPALRTPKASRSRDILYAGTPPPPDLHYSSRARDHASVPLPAPPPPDLSLANNEPYLPPQRIAQIASNASTHFSEFDLLAPVEQSRKPSNMPPPAEEDELEYIDAPTESIPRQPIAPDPSLQRRRAPGKRPSRGPSRPRNIVIPAPLDPAAAQFSTHPQQLYMVPPTEPQQHGTYIPPPQEQSQDDAPLHAAPKSTRPKRSHTQSSIGISVEPPSGEDSSPSSDSNKMHRRPDLLSPEYAERHLPMATMEGFHPRNKPQPPPPLQYEQQEDHALTPLPELAGISPSFPPLSGAPMAARSGEPRRRAAHGLARTYEAAPLPAGIEYPASPLQAVAYGAPENMVAGVGESVPLNGPSGFFSLKKKLPWRRNTAK